MRVVHKMQDTAKSIELSISDDRLKLFARVTPGAEYQAATVEEFLAEIGKISPAELLEMDVIKDICEDLRRGKGCDSRRVARGREAEPGRDGKLVWLVRRFSSRKDSEPEREFADFFTLGLFENVEVGTEIARIYKPSDGKDGIDVQGKILPGRAGKAFNVRSDKTVELKTDPDHPNYLAVVATVAGYVHEEGERFSVRDTMQISGNLDWNTGHIDFVGHVKVMGDVQKGFHVKARGNIDIMGGVLGENVLTSQGSISVKGFHLGSEKSIVTAKGDYSVGIAHGVSAEVGGNIVITKEARDCQLRAGLGVFAANAAIVGGSVWCVKGIEVKFLGNEPGVPTTIELRNELEVTKEYRVLAETIKKHEAAAAALELHIGPYLKNRGRVPLLKTQFRLKIAGLLDKYDQVVQSLEKLREREQQMRESKQIKDDARVNVVKRMYAGVELASGHARLTLKEAVDGPVSYCRHPQDTDWSIEKFQALNRG